MSVPNYQKFMLPILGVLSSGETYAVSAIRDEVARLMSLSEVDLVETYDNGNNRYAGRIGWALQYLKQAAAIDSPQRGAYRINDRGRELLELGIEVDNNTLDRFEEFRDFKHRGRDRSSTSTPESLEADEAGTPQERLDAAYSELQDAVAADLLDRMRRMDPLRFEQVVLDLLSAMGYGGSDPTRATLTQASYDHGLDGVIKEDPLGLEQVVVQAKRYNSSVGVQPVREFAGSLDEHGTSKGVFFTTDRFAQSANDYVRSIPKRIVLIDGPELARLMVQHGVGVTVTQIMQLARVDSDYFDGEADA